MPDHHLVVVPHTHWDREWHRTREQFRHRLVRLVDQVLDLLEGDPGFRHFTLDGQSIVLEDYLEVRPDARERLEKLVRDGRLLVGPWYVLPDEWLVSGEALIRNLRLGIEQSEAAGGVMSLGYAPDLFGHVGQLPQVFAGFGFDAAIVWRGVGENIDESLFDWTAPDGTEVLTVYLVHGYGNAVHLPLDPEVLSRRLANAARSEGEWARIPSLLMMNGSDHVEPQPGLPLALESAVSKLSGISAEIGTLPGFVERARAESASVRPKHHGELRSGLRAPLLPGCASARMAQKRADFRNDVVLTRYLEPLAAWLGHLGGDPGLAWIQHAWRIALQNHPHDSICGCSTDAVHREIDARLTWVTEMVDVHLAGVADAVGAHVRAVDEIPGSESEPFWVWNPHAAGPSCIDTELSIPLPGRGVHHVVTAAGEQLPATTEIVAPEEALMDMTLPASGARFVLRGMLDDFSGDVLRRAVLRRRGDQVRVDLVLGACGPEGTGQAAKEAIVEQLRALEGATVHLRAIRAPRVRLRFVDTLPAHGLRAYRLAPGPTAGRPDCHAETEEDGVRISNEFFTVFARTDGRVEVHHRPTDARTPDAFRFVSEGDRGDEYNFDPVPDGPVVDQPERVRVRAAADAAEASIELDLRYRIPAALAADRATRSNRRVALPVRLRLRLAPGLDRLDVEVEVDNRARDHRLRLWMGAPFAPKRLRVESAFEVVERPIEPAPDSFGSERAPSERPIGAGPQRTFASLDDGNVAWTVANRGGGEVEALRTTAPGPGLALTLLRAVGWLSRGDLTLRPGDAGPPLETPDAQVPGLHRLDFSWDFHAVDDPAAWDRAQRFVAPPRVSWGGAVASDAALSDGDRLVRIDDPRLLVSAVEPRPAGGVSARIWNGCGEPVESPIQLAGRSARAVDLAGRPKGEGEAAPARWRPWQIATFEA
ncbi:MAG: hypothetical protein OEP95_03900 [Myxococcales bacterium]|nr:hypothetical protein [Myxococcales bacterium]